MLMGDSKDLRDPSYFIESHLQESESQFVLPARSFLTMLIHLATNDCNILSFVAYPYLNTCSDFHNEINFTFLSTWKRFRSILVIKG